MKKIFIALCIIGCIHTYAQENQQGQPAKPPTPEERLKFVSEKLNKELQLTAAQKEKVTAAYKDFFSEMGKNKFKDKQPPPPPPPPVSKEIADKLSAERDAKIKQSLSADQFKKYVELEKTLRPKPPGNPPAPPKQDE